MSSFQFKLYEYDPLPTSSSVRLVSLLKTQGTSPRPSIGGLPLPHLSLETVDLCRKPEFDALSYTWGSPFPRDSVGKVDDYDSYDSKSHRYPVAVNGRLLLINRNLYEFLSNFSSETDDDSDAINKRFAPHGKTGLIQAAEKGHLHDVRAYLAQSVDLTAQDQYGETALHYAAENGHYEVVKLLVKAGADQVRLDMTQRTPLACAKMRRRRQHHQVIDFLESSERQQQEELSTLELPPLASKRLWIDAISSNQEKIPERNAQVALMPRIYSSAQKIIIWLGVADEMTPYGHEVLNRSRPQDSWAQNERVWRDTVREVTNTLDPEKMNVEDLSPGAARAYREYRGVASISERTWFQRLWTLQEVLLGTDYEYRCGRYKFTRFNLNSIVKERRAWHGDDLGDYRLPDLPDSRDNDMDEPLLQSPGLAALHCLSLQSLVALTSDRIATDPRDRIFALLSLAREPDDPRHTITVDYSVSVSELFTKFATSFMEGCPNKIALEPLEGLSYVQASACSSRQGNDLSSYRDGLPSWVPDFGETARTRIIWSRQFRAAMDIGSPEIFPVNDPQMICIMGLVSDEIVAVESLPVETMTEFGEAFPASKRWMEFILPLAQKYHTQESRIEALWRTLITNNIWQNAPSEAGAREGFREHVRWELSQSPLDDDTAQCLDELRADDGTDSLPSREEVEETHRMRSSDAPCNIPMRQFSLGNMESNFDVMCIKYYKARRLFRTTKGYVGLGPFTAQAGDRVWLIGGTRVPFLLRKETREVSDVEAWRLVGEAYIHGIMNGEAAVGRSTDLEPVILR